MQNPTDPGDGLPTWDFSTGESITDDSLAWRRLGTGHRCETWLAWSTELWMPVVVKMGRPHQLGDHQARVAIAREADALTRCTHRSIPRLIVCQPDGPVPYLVEEYIDGITLADSVDDDGPLDATDAVLLLAQLTTAIRYLHRQGIAHLDLKPDNVLLADGRPLVVDFGTARPIGQLQPPGAKPIGSPGYASPELEQGAVISETMDLYGLGVILVECLTGQEVFDPGLEAGERPDPDPLAFPAHTPVGLVDIGRRLLEPRPDSRLASIDGLLETLWCCLTPAERPRLWPVWAQPSFEPGRTPRFPRTSAVAVAAP